MVIMERSRSPTRPPSSANEPRPLVGFPVWTHPMGSGTPAPPPRQYPNNFLWSQQGHGASTRSSFIPTVYGDSSGDSSRTTRFVPTSSRPITTQCYSCTFMATTEGSYMTTPRPTVQGCGMAGTMHQFPPPPPSWGQQTQAWPRPSQYGQNTPTPPRTPTQPGLGSTFARTPSTGGKTISGRIPTIHFGQHWKSDEEFYDNHKVMDYLFLQQFDVAVGAS